MTDLTTEQKDAIQSLTQAEFRERLRANAKAMLKENDTTSSSLGLFLTAIFLAIIAIVVKAVLVVFIWNRFVADTVNIQITMAPAIGIMLILSLMRASQAKRDDKDPNWEDLLHSVAMEISLIFTVIVMSLPFLILL